MPKYTTNYKIMQLNTKELCVDHSYQRLFKPSKVGKMLKEWDDKLVNPPKVSRRDGKYWIFDGQHTVAALKTRNGGNDLTITCRVYYNMTFKEEAEVFAKQFGAATSLSKDESLRALYNAKTDWVTEMVETCEAHRCIVAFSGTRANYRCNALSKLEKLFKNLDKRIFCDTLDVIADAWDGQKEGYSTHVMGGIALFLNTYSGEYDKERLIKKLSKVKPEQIIRMGSDSHKRGDVPYARAILELYNVGAQKARLDSKF